MADALQELAPVEVKRIRVCGLVPYPLDSAPSQRYRFEQWAPFLDRAGISLTLVPTSDARTLRTLYEPGRPLSKATSLVRSFLRGAGNLPAIRSYDVVLIHRAICIAGPAFLERLAALFCRPIIFDFDDAIYRLHTSAANRWFGWLKFPGKTRAICRLSSHVTVGNNFLADYARQYNSNVTVIPSSVDTNIYRPIDRNGCGRRIVIGWTGSSTSQTYLEQFAPVLRAILRWHDCEIRVISDRPPIMPDVSVTWRPWSAKTEADEVAQFDIGIMPMPDDPWARGKCAFKALQYMAMGIPAVCSPVGTNAEVVRDGMNGLLPRTTDDWLDQLGGLIKDPDKRRQLGMAGRQTVEQRYSMHTSASLMANVIKRVVGG